MMNKSETRAELIDPALKAAGWGVVGQPGAAPAALRDHQGPPAGRRAKTEIADYILVHNNQRLAVTEAKRRDPETLGSCSTRVGI